MFYSVDSQTRKRTSLNTSDPREAPRIVDAKNEAEHQPALNLQLAKAYLAGTDREVNRRTWKEALETLTNLKQGSNKERWERAAKDKAFIPLLTMCAVADGLGVPLSNLFCSHQVVRNHAEVGGAAVMK